MTNSINLISIIVQRWWQFINMEDEQVDEVDSSIVSKMTGKWANKVKAVATVADLHGKLYNMKFPRRGRAIIFNHYKFDSGMPTREGTSKDCNKLEKVLTALGFEVIVFQDYKYGQIYDELDKVASDDHSDADCLLVSVLSHGENGTLHAKDTNYKLENLWNPFTGDSCSSLVGKPKLFFIQACRGKRVDVGVRVKSDASQVCSIPAMADILVMYSSFEDYYSFRSRQEGSWFIQSLCKQLAAAENIDFDILQILTFVNQQLALEYVSNVPHSKTLHQKKQVGSIVSSLTKLLYLTPKQ